MELPAPPGWRILSAASERCGQLRHPRGQFPNFEVPFMERIFAAPAGSINLPDHQNFHDHWKIPCEALTEEIE
jgi:hypothetical protein